MSVNEDLRDSMISHAVFMERYKTQVVNEIIEALKDSRAALLDDIRKRLDDRTFTRARLERLLGAVDDISSDANKLLRERLRESVREFGSREADWTVRKIKDQVPVEISVTQPSPRQIYAAVIDKPVEDRLMSEAFGQIERNQKQWIKSELRRGFVEGRTTQEITRAIRGSRASGYTDGVLGRWERGVGSFVRTAINHTHSVAREELYRDNEDLIKGVQWVSTLDARTTLICASRDGRVYKPGEGPRPPAHFGCRSTTVPVMKSWRELGIDADEAPPGARASMDGQVPDDTTYKDWLGRQSESLQREVLGKKRFEKWKSGELSIDQFVSDDRVLTLDELESK